MLRLLVLGTGQGAADFRERAASAGTELAQRFSVRVTHVVADDDIAEQDARLTRARTAGVPVLGLKDGERLLDEAAGRDAQPADPGADLVPGRSTKAGVDTDGADFNGDGQARDDADTEPTAELSMPAQLAGDGERGTQVEPAIGSPAPDDGWAGTAAGAGFAGDTWTEQALAEESGSALAGSDEPTDFAVYRAVDPVIGTRQQFVPEPADVRPSDLFTESALESALVFPPLPPQPASTQFADVDERLTADEDGPEAGSGAGAERAQAGAEVGATAEADASGDTEADASGDTEARADASADAGRAEAGPEDASTGTAAEAGSPSRGGGRLSRPSVASVAWALLPLVSIGLLTPFAIGYAARRLRSGMLYVETGCYALAVAAAFVVSAAAPARTGPHAVAGGLLMACLGVSWLGGTVHSFLIRRRVFGPSVSK